MWPRDGAALAALQRELAARAAHELREAPWVPGEDVLAGGCFACVGRSSTAAASRQAPGGEARAPDLAPVPAEPAWAAAVVWWSGACPVDRRGRRYRRVDAALRGRRPSNGLRQAADVVAQAVVAGETGGPYVPGLLARRFGALLEAAVDALGVVPEVLLVDATGRDHPRGAGLALHLGAATGLPTVGVTHRALLAVGGMPRLVRGARRPVEVAGEVVGFWVCTRTGARPVLAHAAWRTTADVAAATVLATSSEAARTPVPLQEARRVAREASAWRRSAAVGPT